MSPGLFQGVHWREIRQRPPQFVQEGVWTHWDEVRDHTLRPTQIFTFRETLEQENEMKLSNCGLKVDNTLKKTLHTTTSFLVKEYPQIILKIILRVNSLLLDLCVNFPHKILFCLWSTLKRSLDVFKLRKSQIFFEPSHPCCCLLLSLSSASSSSVFDPGRDGARESGTLTAGTQHERGGQETGGIQRKTKGNEEEGGSSSCRNVHHIWVTSSDVAFSDGAKDGRAPQAQELPV